MISENEQVTISRAELDRLKEKNEQRRLAMMDVMDIITFIFGTGGIPQSKAGLIRKVTTAVMHSDELEQHLSRFTEDNISRFIKLTEKDE